MMNPTRLQEEEMRDPRSDDAPVSGLQGPGGEASMVERVARALCESDGLKWEDQADPFKSGSGDDNQVAYRAAARLAIGAMREPSDYMTAAAWSDTAKVSTEERMALELTDNRTAFRMKMARRFRAMIDAALAPGAK